MKRSILIIATLCIATLVKGQNSAIDDIFNKYSEREGFTVVTISGKMFSLFTGKEGQNDGGSSILRRLKSIRILSVDDSLLNRSVNFYKELGSRVNLNAYEELMTVKEGGNMTRFLIKQNGDIISELLLVTGGPRDNTLISIRGDLDLKSISELSKSIGMEELKDLDDIYTKNP